MQGQEYLNQISASNRPVKKSKISNMLMSKYFLLGVGVVTALMIIMIVGAILSGDLLTAFFAKQFATFFLFVYS